MVSVFWVWQEPEARRRARFHAQLEIEEVSEKGPGPGWAGIALVRGRVRQIFRGQESLRLGDSAHFEVWVYSVGDKGLPRGNEIGVERDSVAAHKHVEVFLNGDPPACRLVGTGFKAIDAPSRRPHLFMPSLLHCWWIKRRFFFRVWWLGMMRRLTAGRRTSG